MILKEQLFLSKTLVWEAGCKRVHFWNVAAVTKQPALLPAAPLNSGEAKPAALPSQDSECSRAVWTAGTPRCVEPGPSTQSGLQS